MGAAGALVFLGSLSNGFTLDDLPLASGPYRPLTAASFAVNRALLGTGPLGFHLANVLLHALVCSLCWFAARRAGLAPGAATAVGLLFALHPLHVEAVANVAGRAEVLAAAGVLAAWLAHRRAAEATVARRRVAWAAGASCLYLAALLCNESAVLAPLLFVLDDRHRKESGARRVRYAGYALVPLLVLGLRWNALGSPLGGAEEVAFIDNPALRHGSAARMATALWVLVRYALLLVWPARLSSDYSYDSFPAVTTWADPRWIAGAVLLACWLALALYGWRRSRVLLLGSGLTALTLLPASNLLFASGTVMAERVTYLPSLGAILVVVASLGPLLERRRGLAALLLAAVAVPLAARCWQRSLAWKNDATLTATDLETQPRSAKLWAGAGIVAHERGRIDEARRCYEEALAIYPDYARIHYELGELLAEEGDPDEAIAHLERAAAISPSNPRPYKTLARLLRRVGRVAPSLDAFRRGIELDPTDYRLRFDFGRALLGAGRRADAIEVFFDLSVDDPEGTEGRVSRALVLDWEGKRDEALVILRALLEDPALDPADRVSVERLVDALGD